MAKQSLDKIFKNGNKFKMREIDFEDPDFEEMTKAVEEEKLRARNQKKSRPKRMKFID